MSKLALCIGINDYPGTGSDLSGCVNDANDWAKALKARKFTVGKLLNKKATGKNIRNAIKELIAKARKLDLVVIQYSGHGSYVPDREGDEPDNVDECLCPYDIRTKGPIVDDELFDLFNAKREGVKIVMISDSCHSGTVARFSPIKTPSAIRGKKTSQRKVRFLPPATFLKKQELAGLGAGRAIRRSNPPGRYASLLLAACQDTEYSYDSCFHDRPNGAFSYVALKKLSKLSANATYRQWHKAIRTALPSQEYPQSPNLYGSKSMGKWKVFA